MLHCMVMECSTWGRQYDVSNLITIDVPSGIIDEVRRFAAFLIADQPNRLSRTAVPDDGIPDYPLWPDEQIERFASAPTTTARV